MEQRYGSIYIGQADEYRLMRARAAGICADILEHRVSVLLGARRMMQCRWGMGLEDPDTTDMMTLVAIESDTDTLPLEEEERQGLDAQALTAADAKIADSEAFFREIGMEAARGLLRRLVSPIEPARPRLNLSFELDDFVNFLAEAKRQTYASQGDDASVTPALPGSRQLEYSSGPFVYRDVYFGMAYFVGQETVYYQDRPIWSMCYSGGVNQEATGSTEVGRIYDFLRSVLRQVMPDMPFRGPSEYTHGHDRYENDVWGDVSRFVGKETILATGQMVYELSYSGGFLQ